MDIKGLDEEIQSYITKENLGFYVPMAAKMFVLFFWSDAVDS